MAELDKLTSPEFKQEFKDLLNGFDKLNTDLSATATGLKKVDDSLKSTAKTRDNLNKAAKDTEKLKQDAIKSDTLLVKKEQEITKAKSLHLQKIQQIKIARQEQLKIQKLTRDAQIKEVKETERLAKAKEREAEKSRKAALAAKKQASAYEQLNQKYKIADTRAKNLAAKFGVNSREATKAAKAARNYKKQLDAINRTTKTSSGSFKTFAKGILTAGAAFLSFRAVGKVFGDAIKKIAGFEESMSKVKAVSGATDKEFKALIANAQKLGRTTSRSAQDVSSLQLEFSKLGFSTAEILAATEATISLSIAAGSDLAESATVAASTVRGFGLSAQETQRVVDVMAKSFSSSALDLEKFKTAMGIVAPVAKAAGKDIEFVTAQMSVLADSGVDASTSGTSLRNMFLELTKKGLTWEQGLQKINDSTNKAKTGLALFGKRGVTAALILAENIEKAEGLEKAYDGAAGAAEEMARIMEDNLIGDTKKLSSAWEGFILGLNKGDGTITKVFRNIVQWVTRIVDKLIFLNSTAKQIFKDIGDDSLKDLKEVNKEMIAEINKNSKLQKAIIEDSVEHGRRTRAQGDAEILRINTETTKKLKDNYKSLLTSGVESSKSTVENIQKEAKTWKLLDEVVNGSDEFQQKWLKRKETFWTKEGKEVKDWLVIYGRAQAEIEIFEQELLLLEMTQDDLVESTEEVADSVDKQKANYSALIIEIAKLKQELVLTESASLKSKKTDEERIELWQKSLDLNDALVRAEQKLLDAKIKAEKATKKPDLNKIAGFEAGKIKIETDGFKKSEEISKKVIGIFQKQADERDKISKEAGESIVSTEKEIEAELDDAYQKDLENFLDAEEKKRQARQDTIDQWKATGEEALSIGIDTVNTLFEIQRNRYEQESILAEDKFNRDIKLAGDSEVAKRSIDRRYAREKAIIDRKIAQSEKDQAIFNVLINTAIGVTKALAQGGIAGVLLGAIVAAAGAVQLIGIESQPLPKIPAYDKGSKRLPKGLSQLAERRPEIVKEPGKDAYLLTKPIITDKLAGSEITGGAETAMIMNHSNGLAHNDNGIMMKHGFNQIKDAINNVKFEFGYNKAGEVYTEKNKRDRITYSDYYN